MGDFIFGLARMLMFGYFVVGIVFVVLAFKLMTRGIKALDIYLKNNH